MRGGYVSACIYVYIVFKRYISYTKKIHYLTLTTWKLKRVLTSRKVRRRYEMFYYYETRYQSKNFSQRKFMFNYSGFYAQIKFPRCSVLCWLIINGDV